MSLPRIITSSATIVPNSDGIGPANKLSPISTIFNSRTIASSVGMLPVSLFAPMTMIEMEYDRVRVIDKAIQ